MNFDWQKVEQLAFDYVVDCVAHIHKKHPNERIYGAIFHCFYGDGEDIYFPPVSVGTEELLAKVVHHYKQDPSYANETQAQLSKTLRWSGADLAEYMFDDSEVFTKCSELAQEVADYAKAYSGYDFEEDCDDDDNPEIQEKFEQWQKVYDAFLMCFPKVCRRASEYLLSTTMVERDFIAIAFDEAGTLLRPSLTDEQFAKHFSDWEN